MALGAPPLKSKRDCRRANKAAVLTRGDERGGGEENKSCGDHNVEMKDEGNCFT